MQLVFLARARINRIQRKIIDFNILHDLIENPSLTKIFHSGEQDLEILWSNGAIVNNIFDTQYIS